MNESEVEKFSRSVINLIRNAKNEGLGLGQLASVLLGIVMTIAKDGGPDEINLLTNIWDQMREIALAETRN